MVRRLKMAIEELRGLSCGDYGDHDLVLFHRLTANAHSLCASLLELEADGVGRTDLRTLVEPAREIYRQSPFACRVQQWPRGHAGDFETVEYICDCMNRVTEGSFARSVEEVCLRSPIAEQHRGKVRHQAELIRRVIQTKPNPSILSVGCGGCRDLLLIRDQLNRGEATLVLNDFEADAIRLAESRLSGLSARCRFVHANILERAGLREAAAWAPYDLVVLGGVLDYLSERLAVFLLRRLHRLLKPDGELFFTNIRTGNPYRPWMEYLANWFLVERSVDDIARIADALGLASELVTSSVDSTGLTLWVQLRKPAAVEPIEAARSAPAKAAGATPV